MLALCCEALMFFIVIFIKRVTGARARFVLVLLSSRIIRVRVVFLPAEQQRVFLVLFVFCKRKIKR